MKELLLEGSIFKDTAVLEYRAQQIEEIHLFFILFYKAKE